MSNCKNSEDAGEESSSNDDKLGVDNCNEINEVQTNVELLAKTASNFEKKDALAARDSEFDLENQREFQMTSTSLTDNLDINESEPDELPLNSNKVILLGYDTESSNIPVIIEESISRETLTEMYANDLHSDKIETETFPLPINTNSSVDKFKIIEPTVSTLEREILLRGEISDNRKAKVLQLPAENLPVHSNSCQKEIVGDDIARTRQHILCECEQPNVAGAAVPMVTSFTVDNHVSKSESKIPLLRRDAGYENKLKPSLIPKLSNSFKASKTNYSSLRSENNQHVPSTSHQDPKSIRNISFKPPETSKEKDKENLRATNDNLTKEMLYKKLIHEFSKHIARLAQEASCILQTDSLNAQSVAGDNLCKYILYLKKLSQEMKNLQNNNSSESNICYENEEESLSDGNEAKSKNKDNNKIYIKFLPSKVVRNKKSYNTEVQTEDLETAVKKTSNNDETILNSVDSMDGIFIPSFDEPPQMDEEEDEDGLDITIRFPEPQQTLNPEEDSHLSVCFSNISAEALGRLKRCPKKFTLKMDFIQGKMFFQSGKSPVNNFLIGPDLKITECSLDSKESDIISIKPSTECLYASQIIPVEAAMRKESIKILKSTDSELFTVVSLPFINRRSSIATKSCITFKNLRRVSSESLIPDRTRYKSMPQIPSLTKILEEPALESGSGIRSVFYKNRPKKCKNAFKRVRNETTRASIITNNIDPVSDGTKEPCDVNLGYDIMSRGYFANIQTPFLLMESESVDHEGVGHGVECLGGRPHQPAGPFHYLISEQAKSLVALQELQHEVGALLEFRDLVMETFPNLRSKLHQQQTANSTPATMTGHHLHHSNIPISIRPGDWTPGVRVRKKLGISTGGSKEKKSGSESAAASSTSAVQDSGFSTEASSKETHSASSTVPPTSTSATGTSETDETEDELWNLLDIIHRKGTRLKDEVEALQGTLRDQTPFGDSDNNFHRVLFHSSADDVRQLRQERDLLLERLAEMEAEVLAGRLHTSRLQEDLENLLSTKQDLEEQLKAIVSQRGEVNSRIHDLHLQFVAKSASDEKLKLLNSGGSDRKDSSSQPVWTTTAVNRRVSCSDLDAILGNRIPKVALPDSRKVAAILGEYDPVVLQKHLLVSTVQNQVLKHQLDTASDLEVGLREKLDKAVEENNDLRFELENRTIELEGTKARMRVLEDLHKPNLNKSGSPDIIPDLDVSQDHRPPSRTEIISASMKAMSPLPMNLQMDHSSSTESAHDQAESNRSKESSGSKRRPSKIPLKSYTAPKPPGGKHSPAPRSRSGESPHRSHSAHSWRNRSSNDSVSLKNSLSKSRNSSLVSARDSLSCKLRSSESLTKNGNGQSNQQSTLKKSPAGTAGKWMMSAAKDEKIQNSVSTNGKSLSPWILSSFNKTDPPDYPDSLMEKSLSSSIHQHTVTTTDSESHRFQTANTFLWNNQHQRNDFYDSIDSNMASSSCYYRSNGEDLAECDSLERELLTNISFGHK